MHEVECAARNRDGALRRSLRDPTAAVHYWVPDQGTFVDTDGRTVGPAAQGTGRMRVPVSTPEGAPLAVVTTDASFARHRGFVETTVRAVGTVLENARLQAVVHAQLTSLKAAQARVIDVGLAERRRLERDLHDGAQQRLLAVAGAIGLAGVQDDDLDRRATLKQAGADLATALKELRELAHGLHPVVLSRDGLGPAVADIASRLPLTVSVEIDDERSATALESTAYFVVCEALTNTVKHAGALNAWVEVRRRDDGMIMTILDDGVGGADPTGHGLRGLADRVQALGGTVEVTSPPLGGTRIQVRIPR